MGGIDRVRYLTLRDYEQAVTTLKSFTIVCLHWLAIKTPEEIRDQIIGNIIARGLVLLDSILLLWKVDNYQDCWILHRALFDRYIHLRNLIDNDEFIEFERWSFQRQYWTAESTLSDPEMRGKLQPEWLREATRLQKERRSRIRQEPESSWKRPDPKETTRRMGLGMFYRISYDYPSTKIHPMADDGKEEFARLVGLESESFGDERLALHNSLLVQVLLIHQGLAACRVLWREFVSEFYGRMVALFESGSHDYMSTLRTAQTLGPDVSWCEPRADPGGTS